MAEDATPRQGDGRREIQTVTVDADTNCQENCCAGDQQCENNAAAIPVDQDSYNDTCAAGQCSSEDFQVACCTAEGTSNVNVNGSNADCENSCCASKEPEPNKAVAKGQILNDDKCLAEHAHSEDTCCSGKHAFEYLHGGSEPSCEEICCAQKQSDVKGPEDPECCIGKPSPCCDSSCLNRLAARECRQSAGCKDIHPSTSTQETKGQACESHTLSIREQYAARLQALGCLCRALLALGQESCCAPSQRPSLERNRRQETSSVTYRKPLNSCCASVSPHHERDKIMHTQSQGKQIHPRPKFGYASGECCSSMKKAKRNDRESTIESCCSKPSNNTTHTRVPASNEGFRDLETGLSGKEHVVLSISGMTCTGCETKLQRTLASLTSVNNLKTSLILSRAEFDLDLSTGNTTEVMKHLERTTEFKCQKISNKGSIISVIATEETQELINRTWPLGVLEMTLVDKNMVNIVFDAKIVGSRDLIEKGWDVPLQLAPPRVDPTLDAGSKHVRHVGFKTILSAVLTVPVLVMAWAPIPSRQIAYGSASLGLATLVQLIIAGPFYSTALKSLLFSRVVEMDLLVVLSSSTAYVYSVISFGYLVAGQPLSTGEFFETSTLLVTLIMVGRYVAALARQKAVESISIRSSQASTAILADELGESEVDIRLLQYGDIFRVLPDSKVPTDGTVISGSSEVDESMVTGESKPIEKYTKSTIVAGSINGSGTLLARLDRLPAENTIAAIANMVDEARLSKPKMQELADRVASYFVPVVVVLTLVTFCVWIAVGVAVQAKSGSEAVIQAIIFSITVLIVSCPCAVGLAVPMVIVIASGVAAERGVIVKSASTLEVAYKATHVVFDKTGTLTQGRPTVERESYLTSEWSIERTQALLLALLATSKHPVSVALTSKLLASGVEPASGVQDIKVLTGKGIKAVTSSGLSLRAGNSRWLDGSSNADVRSFLSEGYTTFCFTINGSLAVVFGLQDTLRPDVATTVTQLHQRGIAVHILSGDDESAVRKVTSHLDISEGHIRSRCTPADKQAYIQNLQSSTSRSDQPTIVFCGDGTNDAAALAQATIGVHMNDTTGTDVARSAADVVLMRPKLSGILTLIDVSRKSVRRIVFNFGWSAIYNLFAILIGGGAFAGLRNGGVRLPPAFSGLGELVSVLPVVAAAVLMRWESL